MRFTDGWIDLDTICTVGIGRTVGIDPMITDAVVVKIETDIGTCNVWIDRFSADGNGLGLYGHLVIGICIFGRIA